MGQQSAEDQDKLMILFETQGGDDQVIVANKTEEEYFVYKKSGIKAMILHVINSEGDTITSVKVNGDGFFIFSKLPPGKEYSYRLENQDASDEDEITELKVLFEGGQIQKVQLTEEGHYELKEEVEVDAPNLTIREHDDVIVELSKEEKTVLERAFKNLEFDHGSDKINPSSKIALDSLSVQLVKNPDWILKLGGHTDNSGTETANMILSMKRANAVKYYLKTQGVADASVIVRSFGDKYPIASNATAGGRQKNRRVEMLLIMK